VRASGAPSEPFDLVVETGEEPATLTFDGLERLPSDHGAVLLNDAELVAVDLTESTALPVRASQSARFRLVIGTDAALQSIRSGLDALPSEPVLAGASPNPFSGETTIAYAIPSAQHVNLAIYDVAGRFVRSLESGGVAAGIHRVTWNGADDQKARVAPGVYFAKLNVGSEERVEKLVLLK
jgi:hypothetical protein